MSITRIDCFPCSGESGGGASSFVALNPQNKPGSLVAAGSCAVRDSIGSQVASKLALEHFVEGVRQYFDHRAGKELPAGEIGEQKAETPQPASEASLEVLEVAFRNANSMVYEFGHKLAAGGRMAASLISIVVLDNVIAAGRVGPGTAYLCRKGELFPFFEVAAQEQAPSSQFIEAYVGSHSMVSVELASVPLLPLDLVFVFSSPLNTYQEQELGSLLTELDTGFTPEGYSTRPFSPSGSYNPCIEAIKRIFPETGSIDFAIMVAVGPDTIYLDQVL